MLHLIEQAKPLSHRPCAREPQATSPLKTNRQLEIVKASGGRPVLARAKGSGTCGMLLLPLEEEEMSVAMEHWGTPSWGWPDMMGELESCCF